MKQTLKFSCEGTLWLFVFSFAFFCKLNAAAQPLTVHITGGFTNQTWQFNNSNGTQDNLTISVTMNLLFYPSIPTCTGTNFTSSIITNISGAIHVWGIVTGQTTTDNFDNTYDYADGPLSLEATYEGQTGLGGVQTLSWQISTTRSQNNALPYYLYYNGTSQTFGLRVSLPYPFWYPTSDEEYDSTGSAVVSGQQNVPGYLVGTVTNGLSGQAVAGAQVTFGNVPTTTDSNGTFNYANIPPNRYMLAVSDSSFLLYSNVVLIPAFTIVQKFIGLLPNLEVLDANPIFLGGVFLAGAKFPLDSNDPKTSDALSALSQARTLRQGLVADGTSQLLVRVASGTPGIFYFTHTNFAAGSLTGIDGSYPDLGVATTPFDNQNMAFVLYTAPDYITSAALIDEIQASFQSRGSGGQLATNSVQVVIKRAPVVLVHGLWSNPSVWNPLVAQLTASGLQGTTIDYSHYYSASGPFSFYRGMIMNGASNMMNVVRRQGLAINQVDVVGHSMGGLLARIDSNDPNSQCANNNFLGYFRRLITIDTPHFGSRGASVLTNLCNQSPLFFSALLLTGHPVYSNGAVRDLAPRSFAGSVTAPGSSVLIAQTPVPSVAIYSEVTSQDDLTGHDELGLYRAAKIFSLALPDKLRTEIYCNQDFGWGVSEFTVANDVFTTGISMEHDGIVPVQSQIGECRVAYPFPGVTHTGAPTNSSVMNEVAFLLTNSPIFFDPNGFPAVTISDTNLTSQFCDSSTPSIIARPNLLTPLVVFTNVPVQATIQPGAQLSLTVQAAPGAQVNDLFMLAMERGATLSSMEFTNLPAMFQFTPLYGTIGTVTILAMAANAQNVSDLEQTNLLVQSGIGSKLQSLSVSPPSIGFDGITQVSQLTATGNFSGGSSFDVTDAGSGTSYSSTAPTVATVNSNGLVTAVGPGGCNIAVANGTNTVNVPVAVSLQPPTLQSTTPVSVAPGSRSVPFTLIGSSLGGATSVQFVLNGVLDPTISSANLAIGAAGLNLSGSLSVSPTSPLGMRTVAVTTPAGRSSIVSSEGNRFFVGSPISLTDFQFSRSSNNSPQMHLHMIGMPGSTCILQNSANLITWTPVNTNTLLGGDWFFDEFITNSQNPLFYRAVLTP